MTPVSAPAADPAAPTADSSQLTVADRVKALQGDSKAEFNRTPQADGTVQVRFEYPNGDRLSAVGADTAAAVAELERKVRSSQSISGFGT